MEPAPSTGELLRRARERYTKKVQSPYFAGGPSFKLAGGLATNTTAIAVGVIFWVVPAPERIPLALGTGFDLAFAFGQDLPVLGVTQWSGFKIAFFLN